MSSTPQSVSNTDLGQALQLQPADNQQTCFTSGTTRFQPPTEDGTLELLAGQLSCVLLGLVPLGLVHRQLHFSYLVNTYMYGHS